MSKIKHVYWYLFFCAYWSAKEINKKNVPYQTAIGFMEITTINFANAIFFWSCFIYGDKIPYYKLIIPFYIFISVIINNYIVFSKKGYKCKIELYKYLSYSEISKARFKILITITIISVLSWVLGALSMNPTVQTFLHRL